MAGRRPKRPVEAPTDEGAPEHRFRWVSPVRLECEICEQHTVLLYVPETRASTIKELVRRRWLDKGEA